MGQSCGTSKGCDLRAVYRAEVGDDLRRAIMLVAERLVMDPALWDSTGSLLKRNLGKPAYPVCPID